MLRARCAMEMDVGRAHDHVFVGQREERRVRQEVEVPRLVQDIYAPCLDKARDVGGPDAVRRVHLGEEETDKDVDEDD